VSDFLAISSLSTDASLGLEVLAAQSCSCCAKCSQFFQAKSDDQKLEFCFL